MRLCINTELLFICYPCRTSHLCTASFCTTPSFTALGQNLLLIDSLLQEIQTLKYTHHQSSQGNNIPGKHMYEKLLRNRVLANMFACRPSTEPCSKVPIQLEVVNQRSTHLRHYKVYFLLSKHSVCL